MIAFVPPKKLLKRLCVRDHEMILQLIFQRVEPKDNLIIRQFGTVCETPSKSGPFRNREHSKWDHYWNKLACDDENKEIILLCIGCVPACYDTYMFSIKYWVVTYIRQCGIGAYQLRGIEDFQTHGILLKFPNGRSLNNLI